MRGIPLHEMQSQSTEYRLTQTKSQCCHRTICAQTVNENWTTSGRGGRACRPRKGQSPGRASAEEGPVGQGDVAIGTSPPPRRRRLRIAANCNRQIAQSRVRGPPPIVLGRPADSLDQTVPRRTKPISGAPLAKGKTPRGNSQTMTHPRPFRLGRTAAGSPLRHLGSSRNSDPPNGGGHAAERSRLSPPVRTGILHVAGWSAERMCPRQTRFWPRTTPLAFPPAGSGSDPFPSRPGKHETWAGQLLVSALRSVGGSDSLVAGSVHATMLRIVPLGLASRAMQASAVTGDEWWERNCTSATSATT